MDINNNYDITLYDRFSTANTASRRTQSQPKVIDLSQRKLLESDAHFNIKTIKVGDEAFDAKSADSLELSKEALKKWAASQSDQNPSTNVVILPTSYGDFGGGRGDMSVLQPVNFDPLSYDAIQNYSAGANKDDYIKQGIINQDYLNEFDSVLKDSGGDLKIGNNVLRDVLDKYAELKDGITKSNPSNIDNQMKQLENSLNWAVGTSLNNFGFNMSQSNFTLIKASDYSETNKEYAAVHGDGSIAKGDIFSYDNSSYKTAVNVVSSAVKLIEKGIEFINNKNYDPGNSQDVSNLLSAVNQGTDDTDSSNLSWNTLTNVVSTFKNFYGMGATNQFVINNADKAAQTSPTDDIAAVYTNMKNLLMKYPGSGIS